MQYTCAVSIDDLRSDSGARPCGSCRLGGRRSRLGLDRHGEAIEVVVRNMGGPGAGPDGYGPAIRLARLVRRAAAWPGPVGASSGWRMRDVDGGARRWVERGRVRCRGTSGRRPMPKRRRGLPRRRRTGRRRRVKYSATQHACSDRIVAESSNRPGAGRISRSTATMGWLDKVSHNTFELDDHVDAEVASDRRADSGTRRGSQAARAPPAAPIRSALIDLRRWPGRASCASVRQFDQSTVSPLRIVDFDVHRRREVTCFIRTPSRAFAAFSSTCASNRLCVAASGDQHGAQRRWKDGLNLVQLLRGSARSVQVHRIHRITDEVMFCSSRSVEQILLKLQPVLQRDHHEVSREPRTGERPFVAEQPPRSVPEGSDATRQGCHARRGHPDRGSTSVVKPGDVVPKLARRFDHPDPPRPTAPVRATSSLSHASTSARPAPTSPRERPWSTPRCPRCVIRRLLTASSTPAELVELPPAKRITARLRRPGEQASSRTDFEQPSSAAAERRPTIHRCRCRDARRSQRRAETRPAVSTLVDELTCPANWRWLADALSRCRHRLRSRWSNRHTWRPRRVELGAGVGPGRQRPVIPLRHADRFRLLRRRVGCPEPSARQAACRVR